jgi:hypothetical protein
MAAGGVADGARLDTVDDDSTIIRLEGCIAPYHLHSNHDYSIMVSKKKRWRI